MESLSLVSRGSGGVLVGVSGFGSAKLDGSRWRDSASITGFTTYHLSYDAQEFPWDSPNPGLLEVASKAGEISSLWSKARKGAVSASKHLSSWLNRWVEASDLEVVLVGFSLGAEVVWRAIKDIPTQKLRSVTVILVSGAVSSSPEAWNFLGSSGPRVINVWSSSDLVLRWLYPIGSSLKMSEASGTGPIRSPLVRNLDLTDFIGMDHLWAGENLSRIVRLAMGTDWSTSPIRVPLSSEKKLSAEAVERLSSWTICVPDLYRILGLAMSGDDSQVSLLVELDEWSIPRLSSLIKAASSVLSLNSSGVRDRAVADRSIIHIEGIIRRWIRLSRH